MEKSLDTQFRRKRFRYNTILGFTHTIVSMVCGLILPRLILSTYGSNVNGLVNSITNLLGFISLFDMGIGAVVQASLYRPIVENDIEKVNKIYSYAQKFFRIIAFIFLVYIIILCVALPLKFNDDFDLFFTVLLIISLSLSSFGQYYFGMVNSLFLRANQQGYIYFLLQIITTIFNTILCFIEIKLGMSIIVVKLSTSLVYLLRPLGMYIYVKKKYKFIKYVKSDGSVLPEKWGGFTQHMAAYVLEQTDILVLTFLATLNDVSIYSVYYLICNAVVSLLIGLMSGHVPLQGSFIANEQKEISKKFYLKHEYFIHNIATVVVTITGCLIVPFIMLYTSGVTDANYYQPIFGILISITVFIRVIRAYYYEIIQAKGDYKKTQWWALGEAALNLAVSIVLVWNFGLIGVAIGTIVALTFRTIYFVCYNSKFYGKIIMVSFVKNLFLDLIISSLIIVVFVFTKLDMNNYWYWILEGLIITIFGALICVGINCIFNFRNIKNYIIKK